MENARVQTREVVHDRISPHSESVARVLLIAGVIATDATTSADASKHGS